jgi:hypothetical protein
VDHYRWRQADNNAYRIFFGQRTGFLSLLLDWLVVVTDQAGEVVEWRKVGVLHRFLRKR